MNAESASLDVRPFQPADVVAVRELFSRVPERDRTFFREDVLEPGVIESWMRDGHGRRWLACSDLLVVGYLALLPGVGWSSHVGEMRLVVDPAHRRAGIGRRLARHAVMEAGAMGLTKLVVEVVAEQQPTVAMFSSLGFEAEGLLRDHVRSRSGNAQDGYDEHDLLILSHFVDELSTSISSVGIDDAIDTA